MSKSLDRLSLLETFIRISERGSISAAARDLGMSQASASRQLKELEDRFGLQLIRRTTHSIALTPAGQEMLQDARKITAEWETLSERHSATDTLVKGPLKVVAPVALGQLHLADIALRFQATHPLVSLNWQLEDDAIRFAEVGCDCWVKVGPVPDDTLIVRQLGSVERLIAARPDCLNDRAVQSPDDLAALPFVALAPYEGGHVRLTDTEGTVAEVAPATPVTTNNIFSVRRAVQMGIGAAILPRWFIEDDLAAGRLVDVLPGWRAPAFHISAAFLPARHQPKRLEMFLETLQAEVPKLPGVLPVPATT